MAMPQGITTMAGPGRMIITMPTRRTVPPMMPTKIFFIILWKVSGVWQAVQPVRGKDEGWGFRVGQRELSQIVQSHFLAFGEQKGRVNVPPLSWLKPYLNPFGTKRNWMKR